MGSGKEIQLSFVEVWGVGQKKDGEGGRDQRAFVVVVVVRIVEEFVRGDGRKSQVFFRFVVGMEQKEYGTAGLNNVFHCYVLGEEWGGGSARQRTESGKCVCCCGAGQRREEKTNRRKICFLLNAEGAWGERGKPDGVVKIGKGTVLCALICLSS